MKDFCKRRLWVIYAFFFFCTNLCAQQKALNIVGIHQLVADSKSEYELQGEARNRQTVTTANEQANKTLLAKLKNRYRQLQDRYHALGTVIDAANIGIQASPMLNRIVQNQSGIYRIAQQNPLLISLAYQAEIEFAGKGRSLVNFLIGLCASIGPVNQMKASDRKILFGYILTELSNLQDLSYRLLTNMQYSQGMGLVRSLNPFQNYIDQDKEIIRDIFNNAKYLK
jgi:hypothetical protein